MKKLLFLALACASFSFISCTRDLVVTERPTQPVYVRAAAPGPDYVWVDGDWRRQRRVYVWKEGYWGRPRTGYVYKSGSWQPRGKGYYWSKGRWHKGRN